jgi:hypothetical protein
MANKPMQSMIIQPREYVFALVLNPSTDLRDPGAEPQLQQGHAYIFGITQVAEYLSAC